MNCEHSDTTATPDKQEKSFFLEEKTAFIDGKLEALRKKLIYANEEKIHMFEIYSDQFNARKNQKLHTRMHAFLQKNKYKPKKEEVEIKVIADPREGITRRYANYIPLKRYQYTDDTLNVFYPNVGENDYNKLSQEWKLTGEGSILRNLIDEDLILYLFIEKFGEAEDVFAIYKKFRGVDCQNDVILKRFKNFREKIVQKRQEFAKPGCSVKIEEELSEHTIIKTHKELFCRRCEVYDCGIHGIMGFSSFLPPHRPSPKDLMFSYNEMIELYNSPHKTSNCGNNCYLSEFEEEVRGDLDEFTSSKIKLVSPCHIRLYFEKEEVTCKQIFQYLKKEYSAKESFGVDKDNDDSDDTEHKIASKKPKSKKQRRNFFPNWKALEENIKGTVAVDYQACYHDHYNQITSEEEQHCMSADCCCFERGFCDKYCGCDIKKCKIRRKGCDCGTNCMGKKCPCYSLGAECDPDLCKCCFNVKGRRKVNSCANQMIFFRKSKTCKIGPSEVCTGLGLFTMVPINKGDFVLRYLGELISWEEAEMREKWNNFDQETYLTTLSDEYVIDAKYRGNKARFINHGKEYANLVARHVFSKGLHHFGFFAKDDIMPGSEGAELLFDYEGGGSALNEQFEWIKKPTNPKKINTGKKFFENRTKEVPKEVTLKTGVKVLYKPQFTVKVQAKPRKLRKVELIHIGDELEGEEESQGYYACEVKEEVKAIRKKTFIKENMMKKSDSDETEIISLSDGSTHADVAKENEAILVDDSNSETSPVLVSSDTNTQSNADNLSEGPEIIFLVKKTRIFR